uniref:Uncharacterized protein n=1 Tax=Oryza rufipogon TaxID=4529 RepID=A0A0E0MUU6_ORYRU
MVGVALLRSTSARGLKVSGSLLTWRKLCINHRGAATNVCIPGQKESSLFFISSSQLCCFSLGPLSSNHKSVLQSKKIISGTSQDAKQSAVRTRPMLMIAFAELQTA